MYKSICCLQSRQRKSTIPSDIEIGHTTKVTAVTQTADNALSELKALPEKLKKILDTMVTADEQKVHPDAALQAIKFYQHYMSDLTTVKLLKHGGSENGVE
jgi:hypothetical protein